MEREINSLKSPALLFKVLFGTAFGLEVFTKIELDVAVVVDIVVAGEKVVFFVTFFVLVFMTVI